jgi:hypothetical protein
MNRIRNAVLTAAIIGATAFATLSPANAWWRRGSGPFFWGGVAAGAVTGAVVGSAVAPYTYGPYPYRRCLVVWNQFTFKLASYATERITA